MSKNMKVSILGCEDNGAGLHTSVCSLYRLRVASLWSNHVLMRIRASIFKEEYNIVRHVLLTDEMYVKRVSSKYSAMMHYSIRYNERV